MNKRKIGQSQFISKVRVTINNNSKLITYDPKIAQILFKMMLTSIFKLCFIL